MKQHKAKAQWKGGLKDGSGEFETGRGNLKTSYTFASRFGDDTKATSPEELIGAAHAGCFSMFLSGVLTKENYTPEHITTNADVTLGEKDGAPTILKIALSVEAKVPNLQDADFQKYVQESKANCPVSKALSAIPEITVTARLNE